MKHVRPVLVLALLCLISKSLYSQDQNDCSDPEIYESQDIYILCHENGTYDPLEDLKISRNSVLNPELKLYYPPILSYNNVVLNPLCRQLVKLRF